MDAMTIIVGVAIVGCRGSSSSSIPATERSVKFGGVDAHDDDEVSIIVDQSRCDFSVDHHEAIEGGRASQVQDPPHLWRERGGH